MNCRHCRRPLENVFLDLGFAPPSNAYLRADQMQMPETHYPLRVLVCDSCWLVQTDDYADATELFSSDYAYFSSVSRGWVEHAQRYCDMITRRLGLDAEKFVVEIASNDGYLLKNFVATNIPCLGVEPTDSTAAAAEAIGVPVVREFFGEELATRLAAEGRQADLIAGNNVYAHVPDINDFTAGLKTLLKPGGTITLEFPHLMRLVEHTQFDTVYHEHFSYLSLATVQRIFASAGLRVFDVEELPTHGGSIRVYGCHQHDQRETLAEVTRILDEEEKQGLRDLATYLAFQSRADVVKNDMLAFLIEQKRAGKRIGAYGAAAKGNTLLNYGGVKPDLLPYICDAALSKQGKLTPGGHIPIVEPERLAEDRPDYVLILPWNIADEVIESQAGHMAAGSRFVTFVPHLKEISCP